jgi:hypothetical protein
LITESSFDNDQATEERLDQQMTSYTGETELSLHLKQNLHVYIRKIELNKALL